MVLTLPITYSKGAPFYNAITLRMPHARTHAPHARAGCSRIFPQMYNALSYLSEPVSLTATLVKTFQQNRLMQPTR